MSSPHSESNRESSAYKADAVTIMLQGRYDIYDNYNQTPPVRLERTTPELTAPCSAN
jgi:hypothetical protein